MAKANSLISSQSRALDNIRRFQAEVESSPELQARLAFARAWYAVKDDGDWLFAPSKFVGYAGLDAATYIENSHQNDGRRTEAQLGQWFEEVDSSSPYFVDLNDGLVAFLSKFDKSPSIAARISVAKGSDGVGLEEDKLVELLIAVAQRLSEPERARLRRRLSAW